MAYGGLDLGFGDSGQVRFENAEVRAIDDYVASTALSADGGLWIVGSSGHAGAISKVDHSGNPVAAFGSDGKSLLKFDDGNQTYLSDFKTLSDGSAIVIGNVATQNEFFPFATRIFADGMVDPDFGLDGRVFGSSSHVFSFVEGTDDRILIVDLNDSESERSFRLLALGIDGAPDASFSQTGTTDPPFVFFNLLQLFAFEDDQSIIVVASTSGTVNELQSIRFELDGDLDETYGINGLSQIAHAQVGLISSVLPHDGNVIIVEAKIFGEQPDLHLFKFDLQSGLVPDFGDGGTVAIPLPSGLQLTQASFFAEHLADGSIVTRMLASDLARTATTLRSASLDASGALQSGTPTDAWGSVVVSTEMISGAELETLDDMVFLAWTIGYPRDWAVTTIDSDSLQPTVDSSRISFDPIENSVFGFQIQGTDDNWSAVAERSPYANDDGQLLQYNPDGILASSRALPNTRSQYYLPTTQIVSDQLALRAAQEIREDGTWAVSVWSLDPKTDAPPIHLHELDSPPSVGPLRFVPGPEQTWLLIVDSYGTQDPLDDHAYGLAKVISFNSDGSLTREFADNGIMSFPWLKNRLHQVFVDGDQLTLVIANNYSVTDRFQIARVRMDGTLVGSFGSGGLRDVLPDLYRKRILDVDQRADGSLMWLVQGGDHILIVKTRSDGTLDRTFAATGILDTHWKTVDFSEAAKIRDRDGVIVAAASSLGLDSRVHVISINSIGIPVTEFGQRGEVILNPTERGGLLTGLITQQDGGVLVSTFSGGEYGNVGWIGRLAGPDPLVAKRHNFANPVNTTVNRGDTEVTSLDALLVINHLNQQEPKSAEPAEFVEAVDKLDVNNDGRITAVDALMVINYLNQQSIFIDSDGESLSQDAREHSTTETISAPVAESASSIIRRRESERTAVPAQLLF